MTIDENKGGDQKVRLDAAINRVYFYLRDFSFEIVFALIFEPFSPDTYSKLLTGQTLNS